MRNYNYNLTCTHIELNCGKILPPQLPYAIYPIDSPQYCLTTLYLQHENKTALNCSYFQTKSRISEEIGDSKPQHLRCLLSRENLNSEFPAITFDVLNQFQQNKFL